MTGAVIAYGLVVGVLVAVAAECASRVPTRASRFIWLGGLVGLVALVALRPSAPRVIGAAVAVGTTAPLDAAPDAELPTPIAYPSVADAVAAVGAAIPSSLDGPLALAWAIASLLVAGWLATVHRRVARERRAWRRATIDGTRVSVSRAVGPAVVGVAAPDIVVPGWLLARPEQEQRLVVAHEREHLEAHDQLTLFAGVVAVALLPWHPLAWWMLSRLRLAVELDCDRRLLRRGAPARAYGAMLIDLAGRRSALPLGAPALADTGSHLERRILAMTSPRPRHTLLRGLALGAAALVAVLAACEARVPTSAEIEKADVGAVQKSLAAVPGDGITEYRVDGKVVTEAEAKALPADRIATMDVRRTKEAPSGATRSVVSIMTTDRLPAKTADGTPLRVRVDSSVTIRATGPEALRIRDGSAAGFTLIDGVRATAESMKALSPDDIVTVEVLKGAAARTRFPNEPDAAGGVVIITTKKRAQ